MNTDIDPQLAKTWEVLSHANNFETQKGERPKSIDQLAADNNLKSILIVRAAREALCAQPIGGFISLRNPVDCTNCPLVDNCGRDKIFRDQIPDTYIKGTQLFCNGKEKIFDEGMQDILNKIKSVTQDERRNPEVVAKSRNFLVEILIKVKSNVEAINIVDRFDHGIVEPNVRDTLDSLHMLYSLLDISFSDLVQKLKINMETRRMKRLGYSFIPPEKRKQLTFCDMVSAIRQYQNGQDIPSSEIVLPYMIKHKIPLTSYTDEIPTDTQANYILESVTTNYEQYDPSKSDQEPIKPEAVAYALHLNDRNFDIRKGVNISRKALTLFKCIQQVNGNGLHRIFDGETEPDKCTGCYLVEKCDVHNRSKLEANDYSTNSLRAKIIEKRELINDIDLLNRKGLTKKQREAVDQLHLLYSFENVAFTKLADELGIDITVDQMERMGFTFKHTGKKSKFPFCSMIKFVKAYQEGKDPEQIASENNVDLNYYDLHHFIEKHDLNKVNYRRKKIKDSNKVNYEAIYEIYKNWEGTSEEFEHNYGYSARKIYKWAWQRGLKPKSIKTK